LTKISGEELEKVLKENRTEMKTLEGKYIAIDAKTLRGMFNSRDRRSR